LAGWANVQTTPGLSFGTSPVNAGTYLYADPTAVLKNAWAQDQQVQATVKVRGAFGRACCKEVELLIRMTIARNSITGYELNCSVVSAGPYQYLHRLQKRRTGPPGHRRHIPEGFSGRRLLQQRRHQLEWIRFEQLLGEQCRVFRHHSAQDSAPLGAGVRDAADRVPDRLTRPRLARLADPDLRHLKKSQFAIQCFG
jgi:hypothetical protein